MRLIDADALKEEVKTIFCPDGYKILMLERIDNAPTVEYPFYAEAYQTGYEEGQNERPKGEWIDKQYWFGHCSAECSNCSERADGKSEDTGFGYDYLFYNFCPNCGAEMNMRGEKDGE